MSIQRVRDFGISDLDIEPERWKALPHRIREKIEAYNTNPEAFVKGRRVNGVICYRFTLGNERVNELLTDMAALGESADERG